MDKWIDLDTSVLGPEGAKFFKFATERIKGQDKAVHKLARAIDRHSSGFKNGYRPIYVSLNVGGAGSGKTLLASTLAEYWFGTSDGFVEVACSNFAGTNFSQNGMNQHDLKYSSMHNPKFKKVYEEYNKRKDAYIKSAEDLDRESQVENSDVKKFETDFEEAKKSFELAQEKIAPAFMDLRSILVLDHIEDGPERLQDELSMIFERGVHFDKDGKPVSLRNCVIFVTCNSAVSVNEEAAKKLGFGVAEQASSGNSSGKVRYLRNTQEIKNYLTAKFLSHIDRVEIFQEYDEKVRLEILEIFLKELLAEIKEDYMMTLVVSDEVKKYIVKEASDHPEQGIRLLRRKFDKHLRDKIATLLAQKMIGMKDTIRVEMRKSGEKEDILFQKK